MAVARRSGPVDPVVREPGTEASPATSAIPLGRWFGIPVAAHWSVLVTMVLFAALIATVDLPARVPGHTERSYWTAGAVIAPLFLATLLAHEVAHAVTARHYHLEVHRITLWILGGITELEGEPPTPKADALIAASGPLTSLAFGIVGALGAWLAHDLELVAAGLGWLAGINLLLAAFNLLPGAPLDGGRLLRAILWWRTHDRAGAARGAAQAGRVLGMVLIALGVVETLVGGYLGLWTVLVGWFIVSAASNERYSVRAESLRGVTVADVMTPTPCVFADLLTVSQVLDKLTPETARQGIFPTVDIDGRFTGAVSLGMLSAVAPGRASSTRLRDLAVRSHVPTTVPTQDVSTLLVPLHVRGGVAVVLDRERPVGVVTDEDLSRAALLTRR